MLGNNYFNIIKAKSLSFLSYDISFPEHGYDAETQNAKPAIRNKRDSKIESKESYSCSAGHCH
jgi:hypothetical protein